MSIDVRENGHAFQESGFRKEDLSPGHAQRGRAPPRRRDGREHTGADPRRGEILHGPRDRLRLGETPQEAFFSTPVGLPMRRRRPSLCRHRLLDKEWRRLEKRICLILSRRAQTSPPATPGVAAPLPDTGRGEKTPWRTRVAETSCTAREIAFAVVKQHKRLFSSTPVRLPMRRLPAPPCVGEGQEISAEAEISGERSARRVAH